MQTFVIYNYFDKIALTTEENYNSFILDSNKVVKFSNTTKQTVKEYLQKTYPNINIKVV